MRTDFHIYMNNEREINDEIEQKRQAGQIVTSPSYTKKKRRDEIWSQMVAMSIKLVCAAIQALLFFHQKEPGHEGPALCVADFRKKLLLDAALLAALAHALETNGAIDQSKQGIIAALADILTRLDVSAALTNEDVAGQNELTICTLGAQTLSRRITAVLGAAYALFMCHCNIPPT